jgi:hypothetical protein
MLEKTITCLLLPFRVVSAARAVEIVGIVIGERRLARPTVSVRG